MMRPVTPISPNERVEVRVGVGETPELVDAGVTDLVDVGVADLVGVPPAEPVVDGLGVYVVFAGLAVGTGGDDGGVAVPGVAEDGVTEEGVYVNANGV